MSACVTVSAIHPVPRPLASVLTKRQDRRLARVLHQGDATENVQIYAWHIYPYLPLIIHVRVGRRFNTTDYGDQLLGVYNRHQRCL